MAQNIYDNDEFFAKYSTFRRQVEGLDGAPEWASLRAMLPDMRGLRVLDLGCGFGWFCRWAQDAGAVSATGIDLSERMLARAAEMTGDDGITYLRGDLETVDLPESTFDVVYSSLAFHYVVAFERLVGEIWRSLSQGGWLVFSAEHPLYTAPSRPRWVTDADGHKTWPVDSYLKEGPRTTDWLAPGVVKQHRTLGTYVNTLVGRGFVLEHVEEWGPTAEQVAEVPEMAEEWERPTFVLVGARRR
jgi:SAM-dependent methyltransferase